MTDQDAREAIKKDLFNKFEKMDVEKKISIAASAALKLACIATSDDDDRHVQADISALGLKLSKAATMLKVVEMVKESFEAGGGNAQAMVKEVSELMVVIINACEEETTLALRQLANLTEEYRRLYPETKEKLEAKAIEEYQKRHQQQ